MGKMVEYLLLFGTVVMAVATVFMLIGANYLLAAFGALATWSAYAQWKFERAHGTIELDPQKPRPTSEQLKEFRKGRPELSLMESVREWQRGQ